MALAAKKPGPGPIHHSDPAQYASEDYRNAVQSAGFVASMCPKGNCYDNAPMESFFHTLKTELVHHRHYATRAEATRDIFAYIFYNETRRYSAIGYINPVETELKAAYLDWLVIVNAFNFQFGHGFDHRPWGSSMRS